MPIIQITTKQIEDANKAREAALKKDDAFRQYEEQRLEGIAKSREAALKTELKTILVRKEEQSS